VHADLLQVMGLVPRGFYIPLRCKIDSLRLRYDSLPAPLSSAAPESSSTFTLTYTLPMMPGTVLSLYGYQAAEEFSRDMESAVRFDTC
jgi:hypothetical protein